MCCTKTHFLHKKKNPQPTSQTTKKAQLLMKFGTGKSEGDTQSTQEN